MTVTFHFKFALPIPCMQDVLNILNNPIFRQRSGTGFSNGPPSSSSDQSEDQHSSESIWLSPGKIIQLLPCMSIQLKNKKKNMTLIVTQSPRHRILSVSKNVWLGDELFRFLRQNNRFIRGQILHFFLYRTPNKYAYFCQN